MAATESKDTTRELDFDEPLEEGAVNFISTSVDSLTTYADMTVNGVLDWTTEVTVGEPCLASYPSSQADTDWQYGQSWFWHHENIDVVKCYGQPSGPNQSPDFFNSSVVRKDCVVSWDSISDLGDALRGYHVRWQGMRSDRHPGFGYTGWIDAAPGNKSARYGLSHANERHVAFSATQHRTYEDNLRYTVKQISKDESQDIINDGNAVECDPAETTCVNS